MPNNIVYRITDWEETYENNRTRDLLHMRWVPIPNSFDGDRISELIERGGCEAYAAWCACVLTAGRCDPRGTLLRTCGRPHDARSLSAKTRLPESCFKAMIPIALSAGLIDTCEISQEGAVIPHDPARNGMEGMEGRKEEKDEQKKKKKVVVPSVCWTGDDGWTGIDEGLRTRWGAAFPACEVDRQLVAMDVWLRANPKQRKSNWARFVVNWLNRAQDRGGDTATAQPVATAKNPPAGHLLSISEMEKRGLVRTPKRPKQ